MSVTAMLRQRPSAFKSAVTWITCRIEGRCYVVKMIRNFAFILSVLAVISVAQSIGCKQPACVVREEYLHAYNLHDADAVLALYADDAVLLSEAGVFHGQQYESRYFN